MKNAFRLALAGIAGSVAALGCANDGPMPSAAPPPQSTDPRAPDSTEPSHGSHSSTPAGASNSSRPGDQLAPATQTVTVIAADNRFEPSTVQVAPGTEVVWVNRGRNDHDLVSDSTAAFGAVAADFMPGDEYRVVFTEPGEYPYHCTIHGTSEIGMVGTIVVAETA